MVTAGITSMRKMAGTSAKTGNQMDLMQTLPRSRDAGVFQKRINTQQPGWLEDEDENGKRVHIHH